MARMSNNGRILFIVTQADWGGVQQYVVKAAQEAGHRGFEVLVAYGGEGVLPNRCELAGIASRRLKHLVRSISPLDDILGVREIRKLIREWRPDTVYLHSSKAGVVGSIAAEREDVDRIVYRIGGWSFLDPVSRLQKRLRLWMEKLTAPFKDAIIVVHPGDEQLAELHRILPREKLVTIPNGIDLDSFEQNLLQKEEAAERLHSLWEEDTTTHSKDRHARLVLTVANFYPTKDLLGYLDAVSGMKDKTGLRVLIIGDGEEREALEEKRKGLGLEDIVSLPGKRDDIATLYRGADLFVLPSAKEGMPWTLLEAMAASLPCIATDVGACKWMLDDAGKIVAPGDAGSLGESIESLLRDPVLRARLGQEARQNVAERFQEQRMWEETFNILTSS